MIKNHMNLFCLSEIQLSRQDDATLTVWLVEAVTGMLCTPFATSQKLEASLNT